MRSTLLHLFFLAATTTALGINCRGDKMCVKSKNIGLDPHNDLIDEFYQALANGASAVIKGGPIDPARIYNYGQDIACHQKSGICMYLEATVTRGMVSVNGSTIIARAGDLNSHGCWYCGSVPLSGDNKPEELGILVVNWVSEFTCIGVC
ncbi:MAG: hypothetical protein FRX48_01101 [Lasallia pustulata]|uniref:Killer toxin Kp4 domain-containing protein n=1 Tax=Lasallia pustulata TaxID=136370 RepID=A0A5M8Q5W4_9LECA|nr:MAG: hypothetical protein FRX48_01101 [Lasallia pustulata]